MNLGRFCFFTVVIAHLTLGFSTRDSDPGFTVISCLIFGEMAANYMKISFACPTPRASNFLANPYLPFSVP